MAKQIYEEGAPAYYAGPTVAALTPEQIKAHTMATNQGAGQQAALADAGTTAGTAGIGAIHPALQTLEGMARGDAEFMNPIIDQTTAGINRAWGQTGTLGSARNVNAIASGVGDAVTRARGGAADRLANIAQGWGGMIPSLQSAALAPAGTFSDVGAQLQAQNQADIDADIAKYNYNANLPSTWLQNYISNTPGSGINPGTTIQNQMQSPNTFEKITGIGSLLLGSGGLGLFKWEV